MKKRSIFSTAACLLLTLIIAAQTGTYSTAQSTSAVTPVKFPLEKSVTISYWMYHPNAALFKDYNSVGQYKEMEKITNVKINFLHPPVGQEKEQINMLIAGGSYPDMIQDMQSYYTGGLPKAAADGVIHNLKPLLEKGAPNLSALIKEYPEILMDIQTMDDKIYVMPFLKGSKEIRTQFGLVVRKDLMQDFGLKFPKNYTEFTSFLQKFKDNGVKYPLDTGTVNLKHNSIIGMFGIDANLEFALENGKAVYWAYSPKFKTAVTTMNDWVKKGLLDNEFPVVSGNTVTARMINGEAGMYRAAAGSGFLNIVEPGKKLNPKYDVTGMPYVNPKYTLIDPLSSTSLGAVSISTKCKNRDIALAWLDYAYSKEGNLLNNFGVLGESYKMVDGKPVYTELITKNPNGLAFGDAGRMYARAFNNGPMQQDRRFGEQFWALPQQQEGLANWTKGVADTVKDAHMVFSDLSPEQAAKVASRLNDIKSYTDEMFVKFLLGTEPLANLDSFQAQLKKLGIEEIQDMRQQRHEEFIKKYPSAVNPRDIEVSDYYK